MTHLLKSKKKKSFRLNVFPPSSSGPAEHCPPLRAPRSCHRPVFQLSDLLPLLDHRLPREETALRISDPCWTQYSCPSVLSKYLNFRFVLEMLFVGEDIYSYCVQCTVLNFPTRYVISSSLFPSQGQALLYWHPYFPRVKKSVLRAFYLINVDQVNV